MACRGWELKGRPWRDAFGEPRERLGWLCATFDAWAIGVEDGLLGESDCSASATREQRGR